jgi:hypothetical protein
MCDFQEWPYGSGLEKMRERNERSARRGWPKPYPEAEGRQLALGEGEELLRKANQQQKQVDKGTS